MREFDINVLAKQRAREFNIAQKPGESDDAFRSRVSEELRQQGNFIEAHEAYSGRLYDDPEQGQTGPMVGIFGAVAHALQGRDHSPQDPKRQIGDDIASGVVAGHRDTSKDSLLSMLSLLGPEATTDLIIATHSKKTK